MVSMFNSVSIGFLNRVSGKGQSESAGSVQGIFFFFSSSTTTAASSGARGSHGAAVHGLRERVQRLQVSGVRYAATTGARRRGAGRPDLHATPRSKQLFTQQGMRVG